MRNSGASLPSKSLPWRDLSAVVAALSALILLVSWWTFREGYILYYGDAQAHLNISRSIIDSRTPGYDQLGTVWLPVLHFLCLPLVGNTWLWSTGLAGTVPVALCFVIAGTFFYVAAREIYGSAAAAGVVTACFALNPNILYLSVIPMTETVFLAALAILVFAACRFASARKLHFILLGVVASWSMSLTRYDGWFLIPFAGLWFAFNARGRRLQTFLVFGCLAAAAPLSWLAWNWWETGNAFDFYNGPYSPRAIQAGKPYPGFHDWSASFRYYWKAGQLCAGWGLLLAGTVGLFCAAKAKALQPVAFLLLSPAFYVLSLHGSGTPVYMPQLWPYSYYNTRYGIAVVAWAAFAAGAIVCVSPRHRKWLVIALPLLAIAPWCLQPSRDNWICWKESQVNSLSRRAWTEAASKYLQVHYQSGQGIVASFSDVTGIFCRTGIPLAEVLHEGNGPQWPATVNPPHLVHSQMWAISQGRTFGPDYTAVHEIAVKNAPVLRIFKRNH